MTAAILLSTMACRPPLPLSATVTATGASGSDSEPVCRVRTASVAGSSMAETPVREPLATFDSAWTIIARTHWDTSYNGVNWGAVRDSLRPQAARSASTGELRAVLERMVGTLRQSHFSIIPRELSDVVAPEVSAARQRQASDRNGSIGATLRLLDGTMVVTAVREDGSAKRAGVQSGWTVSAVDGCSLAPALSRLSVNPNADARRTSLAAYTLANEALAGAVGDTVRVAFTDGTGARRVVAIEREEEPGTVTKFGNLPPLKAWLEFERVRAGARAIGIIRFNIWMPVLSPQFDVAMDSLRDSDAIVLDLRGNFGGVGGMSMGIAGHFLDSMITIGTMRQRGLTARFVANPRRVDTRARAVEPFAGPLALVVDELSISTTEIFAGGLQAIGRARVFGTQTSGQALPAVTERLPNGDILYHAIADFLSPAGTPLEGDGVRPDVLMPPSKRALLEGRDAALDAAVRWAAETAGSRRKTAP